LCEPRRREPVQKLYHSVLEAPSRLGQEPGGERVLGLFTGLTKLIFPLAFYALGTIVCIVQALVFVILAISDVRMVSHPEY
jgi:hypothetical protein